MTKLDHLKVVLHVEDELWLSLDADEALHGAGVEKVLHSATVDGSLALLDNEKIDAAIVDIQLRDGESYPVLEALNTAGIPYVIVSGAPLSEADHQFGAYRLNKPVSTEQLVVALERITIDGPAFV